MATHAVAAGAVGTGLVTLTASTVDTVTFDGDLTRVEVIVPASSPADVWYTLDNSAPTVGGAACYFVPAGSVDSREPRTSGDTVVKAISSGAAVLRVQRGD